MGQGTVGNLAPGAVITGSGHVYTDARDVAVGDGGIEGLVHDVIEASVCEERHLS